MIYILVAIVLFILILLYFKVADKYNIIDKPNERSSHTQITLRGGGIIFYFGIAVFFIVSDFQYPWFFLGLTMITLISFLDDIFTLSNKLRILVHVASMLLMFYEVDIFVYPIWLTIAALIIFVGVINAYNFMDGINGITVSYSIVVLLLLWITNNKINFVNSDVIYFTLISCLIFAFFNFRKKAKTFAGDVGAVAIAFIVLFLLLLLMIKTESIIFLLFLFVYGVDSILTIVQRLLKKENIFQAHRSHLYQFMANEYNMNPLVVSAIYATIQFLVGLVVIYMSEFSWQYQLVFFFVLGTVGTIFYMLSKRAIKRKFGIV